MNVLANILIAIAVLFTAGLGYFLSLPTPAGPDRAGLAAMLPILQTPRWIFLAVLMGMCVARGAFAWPANRSGQYFLVFAVQVLLGLVAIACTVIAMDQKSASSRAPDWVGYVVQLPPFVLPLMQMAFAAWFLNPVLRENMDPGTVRTVTNKWAAGFGLLIVAFGVLATIALLKNLADDARDRAQNPPPEKIKEVPKEIAEEQKFRALTRDTPISEWLPYTGYGTTDERKKLALHALAQRPRLVEEMSAELASENWDTVKQALYAIELLPPAPPAGLAVPFHVVGQRIADGLREAGSSHWSPQEHNAILAQWDVCALAYIAAARGLRQATVDVRPELRTIVEAARRYDNANAHEIVRIYDYYLREFEAQASTKK